MLSQALITPTIRPIAPFAHLAGRTVTTRPSRALRRRMRTPEPLTISQWADKYRRVTEIDKDPGDWRTETVPHTKPIMDDISKPWVRQVWICLPERTAKTQILLNTVCWGIDQGFSSGNIFWLMPAEKEGRKAMGERIIPVFRAKGADGKPGRIAKYLSGYADDTNRGMVRFNHGIRMFVAWANSPGSMASYFGRINIADETDKYTERTSEGSDPITLFLKRARDDRTRSKYVFASTPAGSFIYAGKATGGNGGVMNCEQVKTWAMRCPDCGDFVTPGEEHLAVPEGTTIENIKRADLGLACPECATIWNEERRAIAYHGGREKIVTGADNPRPESIGWHVPAWVFPVIPLTEIVAAYLRAQEVDIAARVAWANGYRVEDYEANDAEAPDLAGLMDRAESYAPVVPMDAGLLTAGVDVQGDRLEIEVVAWGVGAESWGIDYRQIWGDTSLPAVWDELDRYLMQRFRHQSGEDLPIERVFVDSGYRSHHVYRFCHPRLSRGVFCTKGASDVNASEVRGPNKITMGGLKVRQFALGTQKLKSLMFSYFGLATPGSGYCHVPDTYPPAWFSMLTAEHLVTRKVGGREVSSWELVRGGLRNEAIDLRVYALAAMLSLRVDIKERVRRLREISADRKPERKKTFTKSKGVSIDG